MIKFAESHHGKADLSEVVKKAENLNEKQQEQLHNLLKKYEDSLKWYNKALEIEPNNQTAIYNKNKVLLKIEKEKRGSFLGKMRK